MHLPSSTFAASLKFAALESVQPGYAKTQPSSTVADESKLRVVLIVHPSIGYSHKLPASPELAIGKKLLARLSVQPLTSKVQHPKSLSMQGLSHTESKLEAPGDGQQPPGWLSARMEPRLRRLLRQLPPAHKQGRWNVAEAS